MHASSRSPPHDHHHDDHAHHDHAPPWARRATTMRALARAGAAGAGRTGRLAARACGDRRRRIAAVLGRDPGAGVRAGAGAVLGRRRLDLHHGARHRDHGRGDRHACGRRQIDLAGRLARASQPATARWRCAASRSAAAVLVLAFGVLLLLGYMASERMRRGSDVSGNLPACSSIGAPCGVRSAAWSQASR